MSQKRESVGRIFKQLGFLLKVLVAAYAILGNSTAILEKGYDVNIPVIKYGFVLLRYFDGWGIEKLLLTVALGLVFYRAWESPFIRNRWLKVFCAFLAVFAVFGRSFLVYHSWDYVFQWWMQTVVAVFVMVGYYYVFLHFAALLLQFLGNCDKLSRSNAGNKLERMLFEEHSWLAPFMAALFVQAVYLAVFFPGTLQCDALDQLWRYFGRLELNGHHPVVSTLLMGGCIDLGRALAGSDSLGLFVYVGVQSVFQCAGIGYLMALLNRMKASMVLRWGTLVYFLILPLFPMWGITFVKDTLYYVFTLFFVVTLGYLFVDMGEGRATPLWQKALLPVSTVGMILFRNNGLYVAVISAVALLLLYRRQWKLWLLVLLAGICTYVGVEKVYMPVLGIQSGSVREALSIPMQQTARYIAEHEEDITESERLVLEEIFGTELAKVAAVYNPELSDPVKSLFLEYPTGEQLSAYLKVWFAQLCKHPATYIEAFWNQNYGYFYPNRKEVQPDLFIFTINGAQKWEDGTLSLEYAMENRALRGLVENYCYSLYSMPVVGMLLGAGLHVYILLGVVWFLCAAKKKRQLALLVPSLCILLICLASPVNAKLRYMLPVMVVQPLHIAWCFYEGKNPEADEAQAELT